MPLVPRMVLAQLKVPVVRNRLILVTAPSSTSRDPNTRMELTRNRTTLPSDPNGSQVLKTSLSSLGRSPHLCVPMVVQILVPLLLRFCWPPLPSRGKPARTHLSAVVDPPLRPLKPPRCVHVCSAKAGFWVLTKHAFRKSRNHKR